MLEAIFKDLFEGEKTIPAGCPWHDWQVQYGIPNVKWCEEVVCQFVTEPANTWSNLTFIIMAFAIFFHSRRTHNESSHWFFINVLLMGAGSFFYHMTNNGLTQFLDFAGMHLYVGLMATLNMVRAGYVTYDKSFKVFLGYNFFYAALYFIFAKVGIPVQLVIVVGSLFIVITEVKALKVATKKYSYVPVIFSGLFVVGGEMFSLVDVKRIWCDPTNHVIQGHAIWHLLSGISTWFAYSFYSQFDFNKQKEF